MRVGISSSGWGNLETLITAKGGTLESDKKYEIQNVGNNKVMIALGTEPQADISDGFVVLSNETWTLIKGSDNVYVKSFNDGTVINIDEIVEA